MYISRLIWRRLRHWMMPAVPAHASSVGEICRYIVVICNILREKRMYLWALSGVDTRYLLVQRAFAAPRRLRRRQTR